MVIEETARASEPARAREVRHGRILIVDDDRLNRMTLGRTLMEQGHSVTLAHNGEFALEHLRQTVFDLVLLDMVMPVMDGLELLQIMKSDVLLRTIPVIVISANEEMESVVRCIEIGAEDYLNKPFDPILLRARVGACLEKKYLQDQEHIHNALALELIRDRPLDELFDFILDRVLELLQPSRCALALFAGEGISFDKIRMRCGESELAGELSISTTLLRQMIEQRHVISYPQIDDECEVGRAGSIIRQNIRAAVCAPLVVGDDVLGLLYLDYRCEAGSVSDSNLRVIEQVARFAAVKVETTRLREESIEKARYEEELRMAYEIQSRLLPRSLPIVDGYCFAGLNKPCRTVSGDYYDVVTRPDGRIYFIIADVSGKGITAALIMASLATAFNIFTRTDPAPAQLARDLNATLAAKTAPSKFATAVVGVLDPATGVIQFANAGHVPPLDIERGGARLLDKTNLVAGLFPDARYEDQTITLAAGDSLVMFTDGITEAENRDEEQLGLDTVRDLLATSHGRRAPELLDIIGARVHQHSAGTPQSDDVTMLAITRER